MGTTHGNPPIQTESNVSPPYRRVNSAQRSRSQETGTNAVLRDCDFSSVFQRASAMDLSDTFRRHAQECQRMASSSRDAADKATWSQMAKRWLACARRRPGCPFVRCPTSDDCHVVARLARQGVMACEPRANSAWTCIVGCRSESEIAKPVSQFAQITRRMAQRLDRIKRIGEAMPASGLWHELCDARGALWAHSAGIETALLPDHASEKFDGDTASLPRPAPASGKCRLLWVDWQRGAAIRSARPADRPRDEPLPVGWHPPAHSLARLARRVHRPIAVRPIGSCRSKNCFSCAGNTQRTLPTFEWIGVSNCKLGGRSKGREKIQNRISSSWRECRIRWGNWDDHVPCSRLIL